MLERNTTGIGLIWAADEWTRLDGKCPRCQEQLEAEPHDCNYDGMEEWCIGDRLFCPLCGAYYTYWEGWDFDDG